MRILHAEGAEFATVNVLEDMEVREGIKQFSEWPTIPQVRCLASLISWCTLRPVGGDESRSNCVLIVPACCMVQQLYVNGEFVGGCDIVTQVSSQQHSLVAVALARRSTLTCVCVCVCVCACVRAFVCVYVRAQLYQSKELSEMLPKAE